MIPICRVCRKDNNCLWIGPNGFRVAEIKGVTIAFLITIINSGNAASPHTFMECLREKVACPWTIWAEAWRYLLNYTGWEQNPFYSTHPPIWKKKWSPFWPWSVPAPQLHHGQGKYIDGWPSRNQIRDCNGCHPQSWPHLRIFDSSLLLNVDVITLYKHFNQFLSTSLTDNISKLFINCTFCQLCCTISIIREW